MPRCVPPEDIDVSSEWECGRSYRRNGTALPRGRDVDVLDEERIHVCSMDEWTMERGMWVDGEMWWCCENMLD